MHVGIHRRRLYLHQAQRVRSAAKALTERGHDPIFFTTNATAAGPRQRGPASTVGGLISFLVYFATTASAQRQQKQRTAYSKHLPLTLIWCQSHGT